MDEVFKVGEEVHLIQETGSSASTTAQPSFKLGLARQALASIHPALSMCLAVQLCRL